MTTLQDYNDTQPDKLLDTLEITLTPEQSTYLQENKTDLRTLLLKKFNLKFGTRYQKIQLTRALEIMNDPRAGRIKPKAEKGRRASASGIKNIYWLEKRQRWIVQFKVNGKAKTFGYFKDFMQAKKVAADYRKKLA